jgi:two-component system OmpR family response regulator
VAKILIADDDGHIREVVRYALEKAGHAVSEARDGREALLACAATSFDAVVLDIVMPEQDGLEVCRQLRSGKSASRIPILFLSSRDEELDKIVGLELGADDYVTKPFSPRELVSRVKALLRRASPVVAGDGEKAAGEILRHKQMLMDPERHHVSWDGHELVLTVTEFALLRCLLQRPGRVFTRDELVDRAWGFGHALSDRTVDSHVRRIRRKLEAAGAGSVDPIETVHGVGYRLRE